MEKNLYYSYLAGFSYRGTNWAYETDTRSSSGKMFSQFFDTVNSVLMGEKIKAWLYVFLFYFCKDCEFNNWCFGLSECLKRDLWLN